MYTGPFLDSTGVHVIDYDTASFVLRISYRVYKTVLNVYRAFLGDIGVHAIDCNTASFVLSISYPVYRAVLNVYRAFWMTQG